MLGNPPANYIHIISTESAVPVHAKDIPGTQGDTALLVQELRNVMDIYRRNAPQTSLWHTCCGPCCVCCAEQSTDYNDVRAFDQMPFNVRFARSEFSLNSSTFLPPSRAVPPSEGDAIIGRMYIEAISKPSGTPAGFWDASYKLQVGQTTEKLNMPQSFVHRDVWFSFCLFPSRLRNASRSARWNAT